MAKATKAIADSGTKGELGNKDYEREMKKLHIELVKLQRHVIEGGERVLVIFEGRDAAGKDGTIKHITEHLSPRETRIVALGPPSDRDRHSWYFQRYTRYLPASGEMVLFNRSWYNRAGVERVMGFCTKAETRTFLEAAPRFEEMLAESGIRLLKYYLDISRHEQKQRLKERAKDPLKQWKLSPIDAKAVKLWRAYSKARNEMLVRTHSAAAPWTIVRAENKEHARLNVIRDLLWRLPCADRDPHLTLPNPNIVFAFDASDLENGMIAP
jgi:polyphosphate kinase 2